MKKMKKAVLLLCTCALVMGMTACSKSDNEENNPTTESSLVSSSPAATEEPVATSVPTQEPEGDGAGEALASGWSEEMQGIKTAITDSLGENYWPDMPLDATMLQDMLGIAPDMYEDYLAEMPMISTNVDTLVIVKAKEGQADAVEEALTAYRDSKVNDTMQYPMNVGKIQASKVEKFGNYVCFVQLGADTMSAAEQGDEAVITQCQEVNEQVLEIIGKQVQ